MTHHLTSNKQKEAESKRKPPSEPICCTTTGRSAANSLAQTIGAASLSTREAQVKSTASPPHLRERRSQPRSAAGEPTPPSAPQAGILRSGPRATRFGAAALLSSLGCRSCCSQQRSSSSACRSRACERACFRFLLTIAFCFFFLALGALIQAQAEASNRGLCHRPSAYAVRGSTAAGVLGASVSWQLVTKPPAVFREHE